MTTEQLVAQIQPLMPDDPYGSGGPSIIYCAAWWMRAAEKLALDNAALRTAYRTFAATIERERGYPHFADAASQRVFELCAKWLGEAFANTGAGL